MNVVNLWGGEEKRFEFSNSNHLFISKLIFKDGFDRSSYVSVYIANHNMSERQTSIGQLLRAAFHKYRPSGGTSQKINFVHILLIGSP